LPPVIANVVPLNSSYGVDVLSNIQVDFNLPMDTVETYGDDENVVVYKTKIDSIILKSSSGFLIPVSLAFDEDKMHLDIIPEYSLPSNDSLTFKIKVKVFKDETELTELTGLERIVSFKTSKGLSTIPDVNVATSYPLNGMNNFYRDEFQLNKGYVILNKNQYELINLRKGEYLAIVLRSPQNNYMGGALYQTYKKTIEFPLPKANLDTNQFYKVELGITSKDVRQMTSNLVLINDVDYKSFRPIWSAAFRVSTYDNLFDKIADMTTEMELSSTVSLEEFYGSCVALPIAIEEPFDEIEILPRQTHSFITDLQPQNTLINIGLDMETISTNSEYEEEWYWLDEILKTFYDPFLTFTNEIYNNETTDRFESIRKSVYLGPICNGNSNYLHPQFSGDDFEELAGMTGLENFLSPVQMENVEGQSGGTIDPYQEELAASQYLILNTPRSIKSQSISGPRIMRYYIDQIVAACIANLPENEGRSRDNNNQPCSESNLFDSSITYLASGLLQIPT
jgi:hypothetical protein